MSAEHSITINGSEYDPEVVSAGVSLFRESMSGNARGIQPTSGGGLGGADVSSDGNITRWLGQQYGGDRDVHKVLGYPDLDDDTALERYRARYEYQDIAARIVNAFPNETWKNAPEVVDEGSDSETEFERVTNTVIESELTRYLARLDRAQRLGEYGIMVVGYADGQDLDQPVQESAIDSVDDVTYYNIFPQEQVESWELGKESDEYPKEPTEERYNKPVRYYVDFGDVDAESTDDDFRWVHWSRVVPHAAEGALETDLKGEPALKKVFYRLVDREKVVGASAEMFWSGADEKIIANVSEDFALQQYNDDGEREDFQAQLESLLHDMQKYIVSSGMEYEVIGGQEVDPSGVVETIDQSIAAAIGMPKNKLQGNETGERSTTMDRNNWFDTISSRQSNFAGPDMLRPVIERWLSFGILPDPVDDDFGVRFPDLFEQSESDKAENQSNRANMLQASGLAMTLSTEQKLAFIEGGPDAVDTDQETRELPVNEANERVQEAFHSLNADIDLTPPDSAQANAQAVLDVREKTDAMTDTGWNRASQLAEGGELSETVIQKMAQFKRHQGNTEYENYADIPESKKSGENPWWEDNGTVAWLGWGGTAGVEWAVEQSENLSENATTRRDILQNATQYSEGDPVQTPQGLGVVVEVRTSGFTGKNDEDVEASENSPAYVVGLKDGRVGVGFYKASQLEASELPETPVDDPVEDLKSDQSENTAVQWFKNAVGLAENNWNPPESWEKSETPTRVIALDAWSSMGGQFDCQGGGCCMGTMRPELGERGAAEFCASFKDFILGGWEGWRG